MKILALFGKENVGKSTTLKILTAKLLEDINTVVLYSERGEYSPDAIFESIQAREEAKHAGKIYRGFDISTVLSFNGVNIGITTHGDVPDLIREKFTMFKQYNCKLAICAMHMTARATSMLSDCAMGESITMIGHSEFVSMNCGIDNFEQQRKLNDKIADVLKTYVEDILNS